jgi:hypothetical protein
MRKLIALTTISAAAVLGGAALAGTASAAGVDGTITRATTSYTSPSRNTTPVQHLDANTPVDIVCWTQGQHVDGTSTWLRINHANERSFVNRAAIAPGAGEIPHC